MDGMSTHENTATESATETVEHGSSERRDHNIWAAIASPDPRALRAWLVRLGFEEGTLVTLPDGSVRHSEMVWPEGGRVMVHTYNPDDTDITVPVGAGSLYVVTDHPDEVFARAQQLEAPLVRPMKEEDYGSRGFTIRDADGNTWSFGTYAG